MTTSTDLRERTLATVSRYWGFETLRPLQEEAIQARLEGRDSLVVMPTGGGKSLCYQVPPAMLGQTDIVVSPLISLMKDQVDGLRECGYPATALFSGMNPGDRRKAEEEIAAGKHRLVFVSPERLLRPDFLAWIQRLDIRALAIDEAHCVSHWGHDFRPEYRRLSLLKESFPHASLHAFTATATPRVREDIAQQLKLRDPKVLVGQFDRPNLIYRVLPRLDVQKQVLEVLKRHAGEAAIVYCLSREDTESMASWLKSEKVRAAAYHAGLDAQIRHRVQDDFAEEKIDVVVATVAFGMGIDRTNVRCVIHASLPKSIEHYQQETGRAGRDGLEAECVLFYSGVDVIRWESLFEKTANETETQGNPWSSTQVALLKEMQKFGAGLRCRHRALTEYFGQNYEKESCGACDHCLNEVEGVADATVIAQKILSCVAKAKPGFGVGHIVDILLGAQTEMIRRWGHERLSTYGLMKDHSKKTLMNFVYQLLDQGLLERSQGDRPVLSVNEESWQVMRGQKQTRLLQPKARMRKTRVDEQSWDGVDRGLFDDLRALRRQLAAERAVPPYVIFADSTLREFARMRPDSPEALRMIRGVGEKKLQDFGAVFLERIAGWQA